MKKYIYTFGLFFAFMISLAVFTLCADNDARGIREGVFRFHIIGASDSDVDQSNKMAVRDGIAELCSQLFGDADDKNAAMATARQNTDAICERAAEILQSRGCDMPVTAAVTKRYFPTRRYDGVSLPAGVYDTLDIRIGEAQGRNFWCVMFPDICIGAAGERSARSKMADVLEGDSLEMVTDSKKPVVRFKFKAVELFWSFKNFFFAQK